MTRDEIKTERCQVCGQQKRLRELMPLSVVRPQVAAAIRQEHPDISPGGFICLSDLNEYRVKYIEQLVQAEKGELSKLESDVIQGMGDLELFSRDINVEFETRLTLGERLADKIASFGGSWAFIVLFGCFFLLWMALNSIFLLWRPFDPYPFILLNLLLSCMAAIQAPVIMMSQNRQEAKDRLRSEHDYRVNLKAELEIRQLNEKMDHLLLHQWQRLMEVQQIQMEILQVLGSGRKL